MTSSTAAGEQHPATMGHVASGDMHRTADPPVPVLVDVAGSTWRGLVLGWRGERVYVSYSSGVGLKHVHWVPAGDVRRL